MKSFTCFSFNSSCLKSFTCVRSGTTLILAGSVSSCIIPVCFPALPCRINILNAALLGMHRALGKLQVVPEHILVDGNKWKPYVPEGGLMEIPARTVVKGDATYMSIAAASVLAKTYRDDYMLRLHEEFPMYRWDENKGYPTAAHYEAIKQYGITPYHRKSFNLKI